MIEYKLGQIVKKIKHPDWDTSGRTDFIVHIGDVGTVVELNAAGTLANPFDMQIGVGVYFPRLNQNVVCQYGTVVPQEEDGPSNKITTWKDCPWKPSEDFIRKMDLDFMKEKTV